MAVPTVELDPIVLRWGVPYTAVLATGLDLTGLQATANLHGGTPEDPGEVLHAINTNNGMLTFDLDPTTGNLNFDFSGIDVEGLDVGDYVMPVFILDQQNRVVEDGHPVIYYVQVLPSGVTP